MRSEGEGGGLCGETVEDKFGKFGRGWGLPKLNKCQQGETGSKFWAFCDNIIIDCLQMQLRFKDN